MSDMGIGEAMLISSLIGGGASVVGGALSKRSTQSASPTYDPQSQKLRDLVYGQVTQRLNTPVDMAGYGASGVSGINKTFGLAKQTSDNNLSARGLATSPVAANVDATRETGRATAVSNFRNSLPLLQRQLQTEDLTQASNLFASGRGGTSTLDTGGGGAGSFENLAAYLGYLQGKGLFTNKGAGATGLPGQLPMPTGFGTPGAY